MVALGFGGHNHHNPARTFADAMITRCGCGTAELTVTLQLPTAILRKSMSIA